ncbi:hypothetical protein I302_102044 [Kwoniella bestiolae CBS 10118]|uniref:Template-activating factor I n=1 Tax=Kwoniella bestiolae CBS 10118 TaxID=1296100 RepID=A0AAJ8K2V6_9TREE
MSAQDFELDPPDIPESLAKELTDEERNKNVRMSRFYVKETKTYLEHLRPRVKKVERFWTTALLNHTQIAAAATSKEDRHALSFLEDIELVQDENDFRPFELKFHFKENPYFTNTVLSKTYSLPKGIVPAPKDGGITDELRKFTDIEELMAGSIKIDWKSDEVNLPKKQPRLAQGHDHDHDHSDPDHVHDDDDEGFEGDLGSFFLFFELAEDPFQIGDAVKSDILPDAYAYFEDRGENSPGSGFEMDSDLDEDDDDELDEESDEDENAEIDLEDEEDDVPKKKRKLGKNGK